MDKKFIIDSSAFLSAIYQENSLFKFEDYLPYSIMNIVNASEVISVLMRDGMDKPMAMQILQTNFDEFLTSSIREAELAAEIRVKYKQFGISLGDSFCLASAYIRKLPVLTADKIWSNLGIDLKIIQVR